MRWPLWRHADSDSDTLDPELLSLFANSTRLPEIGVSDLARGRTRVAARLGTETAPPVAGGWLKRRLAWSAAGGGSMWAALLGTAFAGKATTAGVGLAVLLAGVGTAEVTGVGPAVRESLGITQPANDDAGEQSVDVRSNTVVAENENATGQPAEVTANEDGPGNLVTNIRPDGSFSLRGQLTETGVMTASGEILFDLSEAELQIPGQGNPNAAPQTLDDYVGYLALITGSCDVPAGEELDMATDCTVERVTVLGQAGQGKPEGAGQPDVLPGNAPEGAGKPDDVGANDRPVQAPEGAGRPDQPGQPENKPPVDPPVGNPNSN